MLTEPDAPLAADHRAPPAWFAAGAPHVWRPYCQMKTAPPPLTVASASGCRLTLEDGRELVDGVASWWTACHGYGHPHIRAAVEDQLGKAAHVMFGGLAHEPAYRLAARLAVVGIRTLEELAFWIRHKGFNWHRPIPKVGRESAARIVRWLREHQTTLGSLPSPALVPRSQVDTAKLTPPPRIGIVPLERFRPPSERFPANQEPLTPVP